MDVTNLSTEVTTHLEDGDGSKNSFNALLSKPDAHLSKLKGYYVSVDGPPVSCTRRKWKEVVTAYRAALKDLARKTKQELLRDPFLCMAIITNHECYCCN